LIELITVIVILAVIASLLLPAMNFMRARADSTQCLAQLRQIGTGIAAYMNDHDTLPGPLRAKQAATYDPAQPGSLAALLEGYLGTTGLAGTAGTSRFSSLFLCPAAMRKSQNKSMPMYLMDMVPVPDTSQAIWGNVDTGQPPLSRAMLSNWSNADDAGRSLNLAEMWAIQDADQDYLLHHTNFYFASAEDLLPLPAHDDHYNALFFDLHAERRKAGLRISEPVSASSTPASSAPSVGTTSSVAP
jgi:type II secretory pathway pseudopilin PulG